MIDRRGLLASSAIALAATGASQCMAKDSKNSVDIANNFWREVWQRPQNPDAIDRLVAEDFVITSGGVEIRSRAEFKKWVIAFQSKVNDLDVEILETFQNEDGSRAVSRLRLTGKNNGILGTPPDQQPFVMLATSILAIRDDGLLEHNWVERNAWELYQHLTKG